MTHICVKYLVHHCSDNGLWPVRRQVIILTNAISLSIGPYGTNSSQIILEIQTFSFGKMHLKMSSGKWQPFCLWLNELTWCACHVALWHRRSWYMGSNFSLFRCQSCLFLAPWMCRLGPQYDRSIFSLTTKYFFFFFCIFLVHVLGIYDLFFLTWQHIMFIFRSMYLFLAWQPFMAIFSGMYLFLYARL